MRIVWIGCQFLILSYAIWGGFRIITIFSDHLIRPNTSINSSNCICRGCDTTDFHYWLVFIVIFIELSKFEYFYNEVLKFRKKTRNNKWNLDKSYRLHNLILPVADVDSWEKLGVVSLSTSTSWWIPLSPIPPPTSTSSEGSSNLMVAARRRNVGRKPLCPSALLFQVAML